MGDLKLYISALKTRYSLGILGSFSVQVISTLLLFGASVFYARILGNVGYGYYAYASAWVGILLIPSGLGTRDYLVREIAKKKSSKDWEAITKMIRSADNIVTPAAIIVALLTFFIILIYHDWKFNEELWTYYFSLLLIPLISLTGIRFAVLKGNGNVILAQLPESVIRIVTQFSFVFILWLILDSIVAWQVMLIAVFGAFVALVSSNIFLNTFLSLEKQTDTAVFKGTAFIKNCLPFMFISGLYLINSRTDIIMLGILKGTEEAGIFNVVSYGSGFVVFVFMAVNTTIAPIIAQFWHERKIFELQRFLTKSVRISTAAALVTALFLIYFSNQFLSLYGPEFRSGSNSLSLLCIGQVINASLGSVGLILNMSNNERLTVYGVGLAALLNFFLNLILIPRWGLNGAAMASASSLVVWNLLLVGAVRIRTNLRPSVFGI